MKPGKVLIINAVVIGAMLLFTAFAALDTFVIPHTYMSGVNKTPEGTVQTAEIATDVDDTEPSPEATTAPAAQQTVPSVTDGPVSDATHYSDGNITIELKQYREYDTDIYVADIRLSSLDYFKTAFAYNTYGRNISQKTSDLAAANGAILAVNGDFYGSRLYGYVVREGRTYRSTASENEAMALMRDGSFRFFTERTTSLSSITSAGALDVFSFGPGLVKEGTVTVSVRDEVGRAMASNPRTAIAKYSDGLHYAFIVSDGRVRNSAGLTLFELASFLHDELGVSEAYNLDGGGSSTMYFNGKVVNNPTTNGKIQERAVSDIVYIG
jgi:exopolysaccharide biosynthesis protein